MPAEERVIERKTAVIDGELIRDAKFVATHEGTTIAEVLERNLRPGLAREKRRVIEQLADAGGEG